MVRSLGSLLLCGAFFVSPFAAQDDAAARLVPADATILVRVQSVGALLDMVHAFGPVGGEPVASLDAVTLLGGLQLPGDPSAVDVGRPFYLALTLNPGSPQPAVTWVAPVTDAAAFQAPVAAAGGGAIRSATLGGYVGLSLLPEYAAGAVSSPLVAQLRPGLVSVHVDLAALLGMFRPIIDMGLRQAETALDSMPANPEMPFDVQPVMELYLDGARTVLDSAQGLGLALEHHGSELACLADFTAKAGSELDGWEGERVELEALAGFVDPAAPGQMLLAFDWSSFYRRFSGFLEAALSMYPAPIRAELQKLIDAQEKIAALLQPGIALSFDFGTQGIQGAYALRSSRPEEVQAAFEELAGSLGSEEFLVQMAEPGSLNVDGLTARTWKLTFHWEALTQAMQDAAGDGSTEELQEEQLRVMKAMFDSLYGADLRLGLAHKDGVVLLAFGNGEEFLRTSLSRLRSPAPLDARIEGLLGRTGGGTPSLAYHLDFGRLMGRIIGAMGALQALFPGPSFQWPSVPFAVDSWGSIHASTWSGGMAFNLQELNGFVQALQALEAAPK